MNTKSAFILVYTAMLFGAVYTAGQVPPPAVEVKAAVPWVKTAPDAFLLAYDGKNYPTLTVAAPLVAGTFYRVNFEGKSSLNEQYFTVSVKGERANNYRCRLTNQWVRYQFYTYAAGTPTTLALLPVPGQPSQIELKSITVTALTPADFSANLVFDGDFESGNPAPAAWVAAYKTETYPGEIVDNLDFVAGAKNLRINFAKQDKNLPGLESVFVPLRPGKSYQLSFWARTDNDRATIAVVVDAFALQHSGEHFYRQNKFTFTPVWQKYTLNLTVPADTAKYPDLLDQSGRIRFSATGGDPVSIRVDDIVFAEAAQ